MHRRGGTLFAVSAGLFLLFSGPVFAQTPAIATVEFDDAIQRALEKNPAVGRRLVEEGHEPLAHGYRWVEHFAMSREEERESIRRAVESISRSCGERPVGWYAGTGRA